MHRLLASKRRFEGVEDPVVGVLVVSLPELPPPPHPAIRLKINASAEAPNHSASSLLRLRMFFGYPDSS